MTSLVEIVHGWSFLSMLIRLFIAMCIGTLIGIDRERKNRGAGIKTHALVCLGSALTMMTSEYIYHSFPGAKADMGRLGAQVISGVGFLGVGTIIITGRNQIRGLTTAAGLWTCACTGLAIGIGYVEGTIIAIGLVLFVLIVLDKVDYHLRMHLKQTNIYMEVKNSTGVTNAIRFLHKKKIRLHDLHFTRQTEAEDNVGATFYVDTASIPADLNLIEALREIPYVEYIEEL